MKIKKFNLIPLAAILSFVFLANQAFALKFNFNYDSQYSQYWTTEVKAQIEEAGNFLASYIADGHTVDITISVNPQISAHAIGGPNEWVTNTSSKSISKKGSIAYSISSLQNVAQSSIVQLTIHELMHCLGFTHSGAQAFVANTNGYHFTGPKTKAMNGGANADLSLDRSHFTQGAMDPMSVSPRMSDGGGNLISALDLAVLADMGYNIPAVKNANAPKYLDVTLNAMYGMTMNFPPQWGGTKTLITGMGGNDVLYAGSGKTILAGLGGNDVLVSGSGETEMTGDNNAPMNVMGNDGTDIFYIKSNSATHQIKDLDPNDKIYISPSIGVTKPQIDAAMQDPAKFYEEQSPNCPPGYTCPTGAYVLDLGSFKLSIKTKNGSKPTNANNVEVKDWSK